MEWLALLAIVVILGALAGGDTFGETIRLGCGCLAMTFLLLVLLMMFSQG
jgi:hypothetical protein